MKKLIIKTVGTILALAVAAYIIYAIVNAIKYA